MKLVCLDLEGVLVPEIWIEFSKKTGIKELKLTTRDVPDYDVLMKRRIEILKEEKLTLRDIQGVISEMKPMEGAYDFLQEVRSFTQLIILSDTFQEFASPLMRQLNWPTLFCNYLIVDEETNMIDDYVIRKRDGKNCAIEAFSSINVSTFAAGDSYNDLSMILNADKGVFFRPPNSITLENPMVPVVESYSDLLARIREFVFGK